MQKILYKLFQGNKTRPPKAVLDSFVMHFGESINIEWHKEKDRYEAVFYVGEMEHIVLFDHGGNLLEKKRNLVLSDAKPEIAGAVKTVGELMNLIEIDSEGVLLYEVIARDGYLDRYFLLVDPAGNILEKRKL